MAQPNQTQQGSAAAKPSVPPTDDRARTDGGKTTEDKPVSKEHLEQIADKARDHTKDEPGS